MVLRTGKQHEANQSGSGAAFSHMMHAVIAGCCHLWVLRLTMSIQIAPVTGKPRGWSGCVGLLKGTLQSKMSHFEDAIQKKKSNLVVISRVSNWGRKEWTHTGIYSR